jgi:hypothetical protein
MKLDTVTKDAIYKLTDNNANITVAIIDGRPAILLNADMSNPLVAAAGTDPFVVLILNSVMIILYS